MPYYAYYDPDTNIVLGFYHSAIHNRIPEPNVELTEEEWQEALGRQNIVIDGKLEPYAPPATDPTSSQIQAALRRQLAQIDQDSVAPLRTLVLDLTRGITLQDEAAAALIELQGLEEQAKALKGE